MSKELETEQLIWHLVTEKIATLEELKTTWTLGDVYKAVSYLSMKSDIDREYQNRIEKKSKKGHKK